MSTSPATPQPNALRKLDLGAPAAERDINFGLNEYFVESDIYKRVVEGTTNVLIGNRGSGKSAIFKVFAAREGRKMGGIRIIEISPDAYSYEFLGNALKLELDGAWAKQGAYAVSWKFAIQVILMNELIRHFRGSRPKGLDKIERYLRNNGYTNNVSALSLLASYLKRLEEVKIGPVSGKFRTMELQGLYKIQELDELTPSIQVALSKHPVNILIDELDRGWDASEDAKKFVSGLFQAASQLNNISPNLRVLISLRRELYDNIPDLYDDVQKIRDSVSYVEWDEEGLKELIAKRIHRGLRIYFKEPVDATWNRIFAETLDYRQTKSFNYIIDRTLYRPRELIQFCTDCITELGAGASSIDYDTISRAEMKYSKDRVQDIASEYKHQYPGLRELFETFRGMRYGLSRDELEEHCFDVMAGVKPCPTAHEWLASVDLSKLVRILWEVGFLKALAVGGQKSVARSGSRYLGPYQASTLNIDSIQNFQVHSMFRTYLGLKEK